MRHSSRRRRSVRLRRALVVVLVAGLAGAGALSDVASAGPPADGRPAAVTGGVSRAAAPLLTSGEYVDTIAPAESRYYAVHLKAGVTPYFTATLARPYVDRWWTPEDGIAVHLETASGKGCGHGDAEDGADPVQLTVAIRLDPVGPGAAWESPFDGPECGKPGRYVVRIRRPAKPPYPEPDVQADKPQPLQLTFLAEPPADIAGLPAAARTGSEAAPPAARFTGPATRAPGGVGHTNATPLSAGVFTGEIASGETRYWKVRLHWGQSLSYGVRFERSDRDSAADVYTWVENPLRVYIHPLGLTADGTYDGDRTETTLLQNHTVPVRFNNRTAPGDHEWVRPVRVAGWYYLRLGIRKNVPRGETDDALGGTRVPISLAVAVHGGRSGVPKYHRVDGAASPEWLLAGSDGVLGVRRRTMVLVAGGVAALLVAGVLAIGPARRWRRRA